MFEVLARSGRARAGRLTTLHGVVETPVFMPVGTRGTVRTQTLPQLQQLGAPMLLANTYHLLLRPGIEVFEHFGGLHRFMGWNGSILTDSGGFQVFSLAHQRTIDDAGAAFQDVEDGPRTVLSPERSIAMQRAIGSDVMMVMDHCVNATCEEPEARDAMERTHRWAKRSLAARGESAQNLFAIVQGARFMAMRRESALALTEISGFDGYAIGGLAVGEQREEREAITELVADLLPADKPRYLMGVGTPNDILEAVYRGVDMFDCIMPTAWAQHGRVFTSVGELDLRKGLFKLADEALDPACACEACRLHSRAYLHHLVKCQEPLGWQLLANHNLHYYVQLMADLRAAIKRDELAAFYAARRRPPSAA